MKAQSFEYQLRHTAPPEPDPEARLRARRAALAEFSRVSAQKGKPGATARAGFKAFFGRPALLGGLASVCVVVIGASLVWLMPADQRQVLQNTRVTSELKPASGRTQEAKREPLPPLTVSTQPEEAEGKFDTHSTPVEPPQRANKKRGTRAAQSPTQAQSVPEPSIEPALPVLTRPEEEVTVQGSRVRQVEMDSPSPVVTVEDPDYKRMAESLEEVAVTGIDPSRARKLSSRTASATAGPVVARPAEGRDKFQHFETNPVKRVADDPVSTFSIDVDTASYSFARRQLTEGVLPQMDAVRVEEMINYFDYAWPAPESRDTPFKPTVTVSDSPWGEGKKLIHIGIKGYELPVRQQPDVNLVLLLDVSGSMDSPDKLPLALESMELLIDSLKPTDTVAIVVYAGAAGQVLPPTPVKDKEAILEALDSLEPSGSTAGAEGIRLAYQLAEKSFRKEGVNRILLATDGDFNVGITDQNELKSFVEREREKGVYLSVLGFGQGNYRDEMAQTLAQNGNGVAAYIDTLSEAKKILVQESTAALFPIAKDVKLQVEFNPATVAEYRLVGYETRALNREDFNNDRVDAGDVGSGHTVTAIYEITPVGSKSKLIDERRYGGSKRTAADPEGKAKEYGFLKIRYKLPNAFRSRLLEQPILIDAGVPATVKQDVSFSTAVAGFAQLLRGGKYTGSLTFESVIRQAQDSIGEDPYGYRAEFVQLVRKAQRARGM
jgi:Ca-activated chloride channel homolog